MSMCLEAHKFPTEKKSLIGRKSNDDACVAELAILHFDIF